MSDLIPVVVFRIGSHEVESVDGRVLHANLGMERQYGNWIKTWIRKANLVEHRDYEVFNADDKNSTGGRPAVEYALTVDAAKCIAMMSGGKRGDEVRNYFLAREQQAINLERQAHLPQVKNPAHQLLIDTVVRLDEVEQRAIAAEQRALSAEAKIAHVDTKADLAKTTADLALEDAHTMTLENYITKNGLLRQFPRGQWTRYAKWLANFCLAMGLHVHKVSVYGKAWGEENAYPLAALHAWERQEIYQPRQVRLLRPDDTEGGAHA
jgi:anti-repressor protein